MSQREVDVRGPHVRRSVTARWEVKERWGPGITDVREHVVIRSGETVSLSGTSYRLEVARQIGQALVDAAGWSDEESPPVGAVLEAAAQAFEAQKSGANSR